MALPHNQAVMGIPVLIGTNTRATLPSLVKCRYPACSISLPNDLVYCGIHACQVKGCKGMRLHSSIFCGTHWQEERALECTAELVRTEYDFI